MLRPAVFAPTLGALLLAACDADEPAPAGPVGGGNPVPGGSTGGGEVDAGSPADGGSGVGDGGTALRTPSGCVEVDGLNNRLLVTLGETPIDFEPTRAFATWVDQACGETPRRLMIGFTDDDGCRVGVGDRLLFLVDAEEIGSGLVPIGAPMQIAFAEAMDVRLIRDVGGARVVHGNCEGGDGVVTWDFLDAEGGRQAAAFDMTLTDCADEPSEFPLTVAGALDVTLEDTFDAICR